VRVLLFHVRKVKLILFLFFNSATGFFIYFFIFVTRFNEVCEVISDVFGE
jgi:hypothetical protein